ncbi:hypothetical protein Ssi03_73090 [Sphaerisporangium siamense]|nr:hypothetical protein Ssi03_73090 [Sphaerisporangium siamense]
MRRGNPDFPPNFPQVPPKDEPSSRQGEFQPVQSGRGTDDVDRGDAVSDG